MYDWAASAYNLTITSSLFPIYYAHVAVNENGGEMLDFFGFTIKNSVLYSYSLSFIFLIVAFMNPILSALADFSGKKKRFMQFFCYLGGISCCGLYFFETSTTSLAILLFVLAGIGYSGSWVFYNSFLPDIASKDQIDKISAKGFAFGYVGSVILLIINLLIVMKPELLGPKMTAGWASRISFFSVGIWWMAFAQFSFYFLPNSERNNTNQSKNILINGWLIIYKIAIEIGKNKLLTFFLISFFMYNLGVQTVMYVATIFAEKELNLPSASLIATVLLLQIVAILGAIAGSWISYRFGNIVALMSYVLLWIIICLGAYFVRNGFDFYFLAALVGLVMGGTQSLSRATYAKFLPNNSQESASYFSFYEFIYNISIVIGTLIFGITESLTGSARNSVLALALFFVASFFLLNKTRKLEIK
jgi:MFS transporter, UMF1 family